MSQVFMLFQSNKIIDPRMQKFPFVHSRRNGDSGADGRSADANGI